MKKSVFLLSLLLISIALKANSQDSTRFQSYIQNTVTYIHQGFSKPLNLGLRFSNGIELSYQKLLKQNQGLEADLGITTNTPKFNYYITLNMGYHFIRPSADIEELNWYYGPIVLCSYNDLHTAPYFNFGIGGVFGVEYISDYPLKFSIDLRPNYQFLNQGLFNVNVGFGIYYLL